METVEVLVRIPKEKLERIQKIAEGIWGKTNLDSMELAILNGTVLPKGHGDLVDRRQIIEHGDSKGFCDWWEELKHAPTVIEADEDGQDGR